MRVKRKLVLASHGNFAEGIKHSLELICGNTTPIQTINAYTEEGFDLTAAVAQIMAEQAADEQMIVVTDLFGGSVNNEFLTYIYQENFFLIAGMNLPLLIELVTQLDSPQPTTEWIQKILNSSKQLIQFCNTSVEAEMTEEDF